MRGSLNLLLGFGRVYIVPGSSSTGTDEEGQMEESLKLESSDGVGKTGGQEIRGTPGNECV